jgi:hypothetical protein
MKGLQGKAAANVQKFGQAIGDEYDNLPAGTSIELAPVTQRLREAALERLTVQAGGKAVPKGPHAAQALKNVDDLERTLAEIAERNPQTGALEVPVERLRQVRQYFDRIAAQSGRYEGKALADQNMAEAHGMAADAIREEFAKAFPSIAKLNKDYSFWKNVHKVVSDTIERRQGQAKPLGRKIAAAAGTVAGSQAGGIGAVLGRAGMEQLEALTSGPAWGTVSAVLKDRLAKAIAAGNRREAEFQITKMVRAAATSRFVIPEINPQPGNRSASAAQP